MHDKKNSEFKEYHIQRMCQESDIEKTKKSYNVYNI